VGRRRELGGWWKLLLELLSRGVVVRVCNGMGVMMDFFPVIWLKFFCRVV
jgi:hypothetical protein